MTTRDPPTEPLDEDRGLDDLRARRARRRLVRRRRRLAALAGSIVVVGGALLLLGSGGDRIPPRVSIGGVDVGGLTAADARARAQDEARRRLAGRIRVTAAEDPSFSLDLDASTLAVAGEVDEAVDAARRARGRLGRALARVGLAGRRHVPLRFSLRERAVGALVNDVTAKLGHKAVSATVKVAGSRIVTTPARPGLAVDVGALAAEVRLLPREVALKLRDAPPAVTDEEAAAARGVAERIIAKPRTVTLEDRSAVLAPAAAGTALRFPVANGSVAVRLDADTLRSLLVKRLGADERPPSDARLEVRGDRVVVVPSQAGRLLDGRALGAAIVGDPERATLTATIATAPADFTTAEAKALRITERVSEFTTPYACCQPRVTNIQRAAQVLNGRIIPAGARFSLNGALGERTAARGYVTAPTIAAGELVESVGGGVSQVATTTYNAAFFAGLELLAHTPHEFYISRYPMGREATVSWPSPDLVFRNDWNAAILIAANAGSSGITIAFYSSKLGRRVETTTGKPANPTEPKTIERQNPGLPAGARKVIQSAGAGGFSISYTRKVYAGSRLKRDETYRWNYRPENAIVELGPPKPEPPKPEKPEKPEGGGTSTAPPGATPGAQTSPAQPGGAAPPPTSTTGTAPAP